MIIEPAASAALKASIKQLREASLRMRTVHELTTSKREHADRRAQVPAPLQEGTMSSRPSNKTTSPAFSLRLRRVSTTPFT